MTDTVQSPTAPPNPAPMTTVLIANRGEIAVRVVRACRDAGLRSVAVFSDPDAEALHVRLADEAHALEGSSSAETYLDQEKLLAIARRTGADAVHPGYGFLSENAEFAQAVLDAGLTWIGPAPEVIRVLGNKVTARHLALTAGAPLAPGTDGPVQTAEDVQDFARQHGLPVAIKAAFGGGGRGLRVARTLEEIPEAFESAVRESTAAFGRGECFVERFLDRPRHVEAQVLADHHGGVVVVGTRDCSLQRRNQKLVEEAPAPFLTAAQRERIHASAKAICRAAGYTGAGTVEYLVAPDGMVSFLEVNTRLQVEHPVTEATTGIDLVQEQFRIAQGLALSLTEDPEPHGHALEFRLNAEDPALGFLPCPGTVEAFEAPTGPGVRVDTGVRSGSVVPEQYDSLLAKLIVWGADRQQALRRARAALDELVLRGVPTVVPFHQEVLRQEAFVGAEGLDVHTTWIETEFAADLEASPYLATAAEGAVRTEVTVTLDGRAVRLGLPSSLTAALTRPPSEGASSGPADGGGRGEDGTGEGVVTAPLNGRIVRWLVEDGEQVQQGQGVVVLEAMKMETTVTAPRAGTLKREEAARAGAVERGQVLAQVS